MNFQKKNAVSGDNPRRGGGGGENKYGKEPQAFMCKPTFLNSLIIKSLVLTKFLLNCSKVFIHDFCFGKIFL